MFTSWQDLCMSLQLSIYLCIQLHFEYHCLNIPHLSTKQPIFGFNFLLKLIKSIFNGFWWRRYHLIFSFNWLKLFVFLNLSIQFKL
jgi:hypothetical protein